MQVVELQSRLNPDSPALVLWPGWHKLEVPGAVQGGPGVSSHCQVETMGTVPKPKGLRTPCRTDSAGPSNLGQLPA
jgi:hypothetical protein